eukprot:TRINITY_DN2133_c0_g1_i1.p1 TRINITY_DN2133_c0_g1~~TRINITY_DN2133_c0_g1_i1.p1  ORF type:complete len:296 (+),score=70.77 TRINITY_DN2133_c0_g1_i1:150-1037(+)
MSAKWPIDMVALVGEESKKDQEFLDMLWRHGWLAEHSPLKFNSSAIKDHPIAKDTLRNEIDRSGCCGMKELAKFQGLKLTGYEWVLLMDADSLLLKNIDELFERDDAEVQYTLDLGLKGGCANGGFVLLRPSEDVYEGVWDLLESGDWRSGSAWGGKNIGYCYGGPTFQGIVPYYYQYKHPPTATKKMKIVDVDSCIYNNMGTNTNAAGRNQGTVPIEEVSVIHFTYCQKPWYCYGHSGQPICKQMHKKWWAARAQLEKESGYKETKQCHGGPKDYPKLKVHLAPERIDPPGGWF